jgi:stress response protein SCP2
LRGEIARLKGEQIKLRKAESTLKQYQSGIAATKAQIDSIEADKAAFLTVFLILLHLLNQRMKVNVDGDVDGDGDYC